MENATVSASEYQELERNQIIGFAFLGIILFLVIVTGTIVIVFLFLKLRQHERDILNLVERESGNKQTDRQNCISDSAIELNERDFDSRNSSNDRRSRPLSKLSAISNGHLVCPKLSVTIYKEEAHVYGNKPPMDQVMMAAQDFYKSRTGTDSIVPAEDVQVVNKDTNRRTAHSRIFTEDWREGTPTSLLFEGSTQSFDNIVTQNKGIFVHKTIGPHGGKLDISGVFLEIPPNALTQPTLITLGVFWDERFQPSLTKKQSLLSPIVLCQPTATKFKVPVILSFPHAAVRITEDWDPKIIKREGKLSEENDWTNLTLADYDERNVTESRITLKLKHFTLYTCLGESKFGKTAAKVVNLVAFASKLTRGSFFKPRIYCLNDYKELDDVTKVTTIIDPASNLAEMSSLIIHDNEQDILVELAKLSEGWNVAGDKIERLQFELIWHACQPNCTFVLKPTRSSQPEIVCEFHAYQDGAENKFSKLKIAETLTASSSPLSSSNDPQEELINELVILLDPVNAHGTDAGDWKSLAEKMGCGVARIRWVGIQSTPTKVLIEKWLEDNKTFEELEELMTAINRPDAAEEIRKRLPDLVSFTET